MGRKNKLLLPVGDTTVLGAVLAAASDIADTDVLVVTGHEADAVGRLAHAMAIRSVHNPAFASGMGSSIRAGVAAADPASAMMIWPGDLPFVQPATVRALLGLATPELHETILARPTYLGTAGHPVLFGAAYRAELLATDPARGALPIVHRHRAFLQDLAVDDPGILRDIDTPDDL